MKNLFLLGLVIGAAYSAIDTMAVTQKTMEAIDAQSFERNECVQVYDVDSDGEIVEHCNKRNTNE